jgi:hypothetical protein
LPNINNNRPGLRQSFSTLNNIYSNNNNKNSNFPILTYNYNPMNNRMQRSQSQLWDRTRGPYGVRFDEMEKHRRGGQRQYKNDLEYLISLKNEHHGDMTQKEWEEYNRKLHYMNDRYAYGELDRINFLRGMMKGYENESDLKREKMRRMKLKQNEEERKKLVDVDAMTRIEKEKERERKRRLYNDQMDDLDKFNRRKELNYLKQKQEDEKIIKNFKNESDKWDLPYNQMQDKLRNSNNRMFGNISKYNNILGDPIDPKVFGAKNDLEFNKMIADQKELRRRQEKLNPNYYNELMKQKKELEEDMKRKRENDINRQKLYKEYLDNQNQLDKLNKLKNQRDDMRPQLIMPSYYYPNLPEPIYHKARDSLLASKNQENYFGKNMNKFFSGDASSNTLLDYEGSSRYLGDSKLRHNPITCPVNDYYYNKYINRLKKESEVIPVDYNRAQNNQRNNLIQRGNYVIK